MFVLHSVKLPWERLRGMKSLELHGMEWALSDPCIVAAALVIPDQGLHATCPVDVGSMDP
jgi:hypothetical protein